MPEVYASSARTMLGHGIEGVVYDLGNGRVLKVNVKGDHARLASIKRKIANKRWAAQIYDSGPLSPQGFWYVAAKMKPLNDHEYRQVHRIGYALYAKYKGVLTAAQARDVQKDALSKLPPKLASVVSAALSSGYHDMHGGNVMRTYRGAYRVVDVESLRPLPAKRLRYGR